MAKYLKVPLDAPYEDGYILCGTNEKGHTVYLSKLNGQEAAWLGYGEDWAFFHTDAEALKTLGNLTTIPAYNIPVDTPELLKKRNPENEQWDRLLEKFIPHSDVLEE